MTRQFGTVRVCLSKKAFSLGGILAIAFNSGCGKSSVTITPSELEGTWTTSCQASGGTSSKSTYNFTGSYQATQGSISSSNPIANGTPATDPVFTQTIYAYTDPACANLSNTTVVTGHVSLAASSVTTPSGSKSFDVTTTTVSITPNTASCASAFNSASYCGFNTGTTWQSGNSVNVTGLTCGGLAYPAAGQATFSVYQLNGTSLTLGNTAGSNDGSTTAKRPTTLQAFSYGKQ